MKGGVFRLFFPWVGVDSVGCYLVDYQQYFLLKIEAEVERRHRGGSELELEGDECPAGQNLNGFVRTATLGDLMCAELPLSEHFGPYIPE